MRVLVVEDVESAAQGVVDRMIGAGHTVARCNDPGAPGFPCKGLAATPACPLELGPVDVAIVVRGATHAAPTSSEVGARCALRHHVPLVAVGQHEASPYLGFAAALTQGPEGVVHAVEQVATRPSPAHGLEAERVFGQVLAAHDLGHVAVAAEVRRHHGSLGVQLRSDEEIPQHVANIVAVRVSGAIRAFDPDAVTIGVSVIPPMRSKP